MAIYHIVAEDNKKMYCGLTKGDVGPNFVMAHAAVELLRNNRNDFICWKCHNAFVQRVDEELSKGEE